MSRERQLHPTFPAFQRWVIDRLVGVLANDPTNVVLHVVSRWIDQNAGFLASLGITVEEWRKSQGPGASIAGAEKKHRARKRGE